MYTFTEQCEEIADLKLEDGTTKIFLNMTSKNGRPELVSLLQYMKHTKIKETDLSQFDPRIQKLNSVVCEVLESAEWEAVKSNILEIGMTKGREIGFEIGRKEGHEKGREEGRREKLKEQISRKIQKGKSAEIIAAELDEELDVILPLYQQLTSSS